MIKIEPVCVVKYSITLVYTIAMKEYVMNRFDIHKQTR